MLKKIFRCQYIGFFLDNFFQGLPSSFKSDRIKTTVVSMPVSCRVKTTQKLNALITLLFSSSLAKVPTALIFTISLFTLHSYSGGLGLNSCLLEAVLCSGWVIFRRWERFRFWIYNDREIGHRPLSGVRTLKLRWYFTGKTAKIKKRRCFPNLAAEITVAIFTQKRR